MAELRIPCPQCGKQLKLPDRSLLGRKGRCPQCHHSIILTEPANADATDDEPTNAEPPNADATDSAQTDGSLEFAALEQIASTDNGVSRLRETRRRTVRGRNLGIVVGLVVASMLVGFYFVAKNHLTQSEPQQADSRKTESQQTPVTLPRGNHGARDSQQDRNEDVAVQASSTHGKPISLLFIPTGAGLIVNLHPAELWRPGSRGERVRTGLGPLGEWAESAIRKYGLFDPSEIDTLLACLIFGARGTPPEVAVVVHLKREHKRSELLERFEGRRVDEHGQPVYVTDSRAFFIADSKTFASVPKSLADEMVQARVHPGLPSGELDELLAHTDQQRDLTVVFEPYTLPLHQDVLFPQTVHRLIERLADWFGDNVEAVAWSLHWGRTFRSELLLRNKPIIPPSRLKREIKQKLENLPPEILTAVGKMNPRRKGPRKVIGRFPAMVQAYVLETVFNARDRTVRLTTVLHELAAPNLAIGTLLTWNESIRTDFSKPTGKPASGGPQLPDRIADRLKQKIDIDFRRTPLQEAFAYIAQETHVTIVIDGDALKLSGYTKNMPQTFTLELVPATKALYEIVKKYDEMVLILDEKTKVLTVMTKAVATDKKLKPFKVGP